MKKREKLSLKDSVQDIIVKMSEGNPGAIRVLCEVAKSSDGWMALLDLDDMNIRGPQVWLGFKDHCKENLPAFLKAVKDRDPAMVRTINQEFTDHRAVTHRGQD